MPQWKKMQPLPLIMTLCGSLTTPLICANELDPLFSLPLDELMNIDVSLTSRVDETQFNVPAAVYVLSQEDIRRSGHRRLPDLLRMVPGLHVAKIDANKWAVSSRNDQSRFSSTMLVMIDGRSIYSPFYAGVNWESQDTFIEDIDHIEVVRGPGGSLWGTNAVDGIINIITKSSTDTHGSKAYALIGQGEMKYDAGFRYGNQLSNGVNYRVFAKTFKTDHGEYADSDESTNNNLASVGSDANDDGNAKQFGMRTDWTTGKDNFMLQANAFDGDFDEDRVVSGLRVPNLLETGGHNLTLNWKRQLTTTNALSVLSFYSQTSRDDGVLHNDEATFDIDIQHNMTSGIHNPVWGLGFRHYDNKAKFTSPASCSGATPCFGVDPENKTLKTWSAFIQDRMAFSKTFSLIIGSKFEGNDYTGFEYQPTMRGLWTPDTNTTYWAAITRAARVPDRVSTDGILDFGSGTVQIGSKDSESFIIHTYELGHRQRMPNNWAIDSTVFYSDYRNTIQDNSGSGLDYTYGFESYIKHEFSPVLSAELAYTYNRGRTDIAAGGDRPTSMLPRNTVHLRSYYQLNNNMELDALLYFVSEAKSVSGTIDIPSYTRADIRFGWQATKQLDMSLLLSNLLDDAHTEGFDSFKINTAANRGIMLKLTYSIDPPH